MRGGTRHARYLYTMSTFRRKICVANTLRVLTCSKRVLYIITEPLPSSFPKGSITLRELPATSPQSLAPPAFPAFPTSGYLRLPLLPSSPFFSQTRPQGGSHSFSLSLLFIQPPATFFYFTSCFLFLSMLY